MGFTRGKSTNELFMSSAQTKPITPSVPVSTINNSELRKLLLVDHRYFYLDTATYLIRMDKNYPDKTFLTHYLPGVELSDYISDDKYANYLLTEILRDVLINADFCAQSAGLDLFSNIDYKQALINIDPMDYEIKVATTPEMKLEYSFFEKGNEILRCVFNNINYYPDKYFNDHDKQSPIDTIYDLMQALKLGD